MRPAFAGGLDEAAEAVDHVGGHRVGDEVRGGLDVEQDPLGVAVCEEVVDEDEIGNQLASGVVGHHGHGGRRRDGQQPPQRGAVVGDQPWGDGFARHRPGRRDAEAEVRAVAPERGVQEGGAPLTGRSVGERVQGPQLLPDRLTPQFGPLERREGVDSAPRSGTEVSDGAEEPPVEVVLGPQERGVVPGAPEVLPPPGRPALLVVVRVGGGERADDVVGDLSQQDVEGLVLATAVREGVPYLPDEGGVAVGQYAPGERAGHVAPDDRGRVGPTDGSGAGAKARARARACACAGTVERCFARGAGVFSSMGCGPFASRSVT